MNTKTLYLFLVLLLGILLCSFLGSSKEGLENNTTTYTGPHDITAIMTTKSDGTQTITITRGPETEVFTQLNANTFTNPQNGTVMLSNGNILIPSFHGGTLITLTPSTTGTSTTSPSTTTLPSTTGTSYDNYNHFTGSSSSAVTTGTTFYGPNGELAQMVTDSNGIQSLKVTLSNGTAPVVYTTTPSTSSIFYGQNGGTATIVKGSDGQQTIQVKTSAGTITYTQPGTSITSTQYYGSTGTPIQSSQNIMAYQGLNTNSTATSSGYGSEYYSASPPGIPASQIPSGKSDLYILKSEIVPPICPVCPTYPIDVLSKSKSTLKSNDNNLNTNDNNSNSNNASNFNSNSYDNNSNFNSASNFNSNSYDNNFNSNFNSASNFNSNSYDNNFNSNASEMAYKPRLNYNEIDKNLLPQPVVSDFSSFGM
jgi:hypothetical protein